MPKGYGYPSKPKSKPKGGKKTKPAKKKARVR
jgi:hypothetical protein